jgi:hypothetical protein
MRGLAASGVLAAACLLSCERGPIAIEIDRGAGVQSVLVLVAPSAVPDQTFDAFAIDVDGSGSDALPLVSGAVVVRVVRFDLDRPLSAFMLAPGLLAPATPPDPGRALPAALEIQERLVDHGSATDWRSLDPTLPDPHSYRLAAPGGVCLTFQVTPLALPDLAAPNPAPAVIVPLDDTSAVVVPSDGRPLRLDLAQRTLTRITGTSTLPAGAGALGSDGVTVYLGGAATQAVALTLDPNVVTPIAGPGVATGAFVSFDAGPFMPGPLLRLFAATDDGQFFRLRVVSWEHAVPALDPPPRRGLVKALFVGQVEGMMVRHETSVAHYTAGLDTPLVIEPIASASTAVPLSALAIAPMIGTVALGDGGAAFVRTGAGTWRRFATLAGLGQVEDAIAFQDGLLAADDGGRIAQLLAGPRACAPQTAWARTIRRLAAMGGEVVAAPEADGIHGSLLILTPSTN